MARKSTKKAGEGVPDATDGVRSGADAEEIVTSNGDADSIAQQEAPKNEGVDMGNGTTLVSH